LVSIVADRYKKSIFKNKKYSTGSEPTRPRSRCRGRRSPSATRRGRRRSQPSLQVEVTPPRFAASPDPRLLSSDPDWSLASVGVLVAVVKGEAPCLNATAAAPIHHCRASMPAHRGAAHGSEKSRTAGHNLALCHTADHHLACRRPPPRVEPPLASLNACTHAC
jgi:hypothetical protein